VDITCQANLPWLENVGAYDVDRTLDGFKLILFLVRASGTGMLRQREVKEEGMEGVALD